MRKLFNKLFGFTPKVTLELNSVGCYVVKANGQYLTSSITTDKEKAERFFNYVVELQNGEHKTTYKVIKESSPQ